MGSHKKAAEIGSVLIVLLVLYGKQLCYLTIYFISFLSFLFLNQLPCLVKESEIVTTNAGIVPPYLRLWEVECLLGTPASCHPPSPADCWVHLPVCNRLQVGHSFLHCLSFVNVSRMNGSHVTNCLRVSYWGSKPGMKQNHSPCPSLHVPSACISFWI